jgi:hypothetical protein
VVPKYRSLNIDLTKVQRQASFRKIGDKASTVNANNLRATR